MKEKIYRIRSLDETNHLASAIAKEMKAPALLVLSGDLGAGKTTFTKGLAKALGVQKTVTSPTFTILKSYQGNMITLHHIDAYRLEGISQDLGFEEIFEEEDAVCVVEWYQYIEDVLSKERLFIEIALDGEERIFTLKANGAQYEAILEVL